MNTITVEQDRQLSVDTQRINSGLVAFDERKATLEALKEKATGLKIVSIEDKETIKEVSDIRKELKSARVEIEKEGKSMRDQLTKVSRHISEKEKELVAIIEPTEKELLAQEEWVKNEKEKIRQEEEAKERQRIQTRIDRLAEYGFTIDYTLISSISDEDFEGVAADAKAAHERELAAKAEAERLEKEAEDKRKADEEAEKLRLKAEREELESLREKQREQQRLIDEQNEKIRADQQKLADEQEKIRRQKTNSRCDQLKAMGLFFNGNEYAFKDVNVHIAEIQTLEDDKWDALIEKITPAIIERKEEVRIEEERLTKEREQAEKERIAKLQKEAAEKALKDKEDADRLAKEREEERQAMLSDKEKFRVLHAAIHQITIPEMKSAKANKILSQVKEILSNAAAHIEDNVLRSKAVA